jgi:RNA polymerase sigma-70 factor (ECF subfamily)
MERNDPLPPEIELAQLLQNCAARDSGAFRVLYEKTSPILFARLLRMLRRRSVAEEALQEVFVRIWERAAQYEIQRGRALAWMITIARYCAIDLMRRERLTLIGDDALAEVADENAAEPGALEKPNHFDECIGQLSQTTQHCLTLAFVEGRSHDEIARLTSSPLGSVKSWIRRGSSVSRNASPRSGRPHEVGQRELLDRLAAEYVLGTCAAGAPALRALAGSPQVQVMVNDWEQRLAGLEPRCRKSRHPPGCGRASKPARLLGEAAPSTVRWLAIAATVLLAVIGIFTLRRSRAGRDATERPSRRIPRLSTGASNCSATTRSSPSRPGHASARVRQGTRVVDPAGAREPGVAGPAAGERHAAPAAQPPRSARRSPGPNNWRSASSLRAARPRVFRPVR